MFTTQTGNKAGGDIVAGDKKETHIHGPQSPLSALYQKLREAEGPQPAAISDQLQHFCNVVTEGDVRGLEEKLSASDRQDLIIVAAQLKQSAFKTIMKWQTSGVAQDILTYVLATLHKDFLLNVTPAIQAGAPRVEIDKLINEKVLEPSQQILGDNDLMLTPHDLLGLLFFLGGNCHVRWDKC